jgi:hypothetical protein
VTKHYRRGGGPIRVTYVKTGRWTAPPSPDPREEACRRVDGLKGHRGKDGKPLTRNERIKRAAKEYGFDFKTLRNYKNRAKRK